MISTTKEVEMEFFMLLKLSFYKFKLECYGFTILNVILVLTAKKIAIGYTEQEMRKEFVSLQK